MSAERATPSLGMYIYAHVQVRRKRARERGGWEINGMYPYDSLLTSYV